MSLVLAALLLSNSSISGFISPNQELKNKKLGRGVVMLSSIVLPGSGQLLSGVKKRGEVMLWMDGIFFSGWAGFAWLQRSREQDARLIAKRYASADITITDRRYYRALEVYDNAEQFNEDIRREAREMYPNDPDAQRRYYQARGYFGSAQWDWSSDSLRIYSYWRTRRTARTAGMNASFLAAALVLNRLVSFLDCLFFLPEAKLRSRLEFKPTENQLGVKFSYRL